MWKPGTAAVGQNPAFGDFEMAARKLTFAGYSTINAMVVCETEHSDFADLVIEAGQDL